jgi:tRNA threonylcarbamoyladenosine biosynthesis protein TsaE
MKIATIQDLDNLIEKEFTTLKPPVMILLNGDVGAGKTTFVRELLKSFGVKNVSSPTFALHHEYQGKFKIDHFDFYRLANEAELDSTGFWDLMEEKEAFIIIEWPEKIKFSFKPNGWKIFTVNIKLVSPFAGHHSQDREISISQQN